MGEDRRRLVVMLLVVFAFTVVVFAVSPVITNFDSYPAFPTAVSIVNRHTLSLDAYRHVPLVTGNGGVTQTNGQLLTFFPWAVSLFAVPAVVVLDVLHLFGGPSADAAVRAGGLTQSLVQMWSASVATALGCTVLTFLAYRRLRGTARTRRLVAAACGLTFAFTTSAWSVASRALWQHGPALLLLGLGLVALDRIFPTAAHSPTARRAPALGAGAAFAAAVVVRPTDLIPFAVVGAMLLWRRRSAVVPYVVGAVVVFVPWIAVTYDAYGSLLQPYNSANRLSAHGAFGEALAANLVSPARGLLVFSPVCLLAIAGLVVAIRARNVGVLEIVSVIVVPLYWIAASAYWQWWAGHTYGARFMSETLPFLFVLALPFVDWLVHTERSHVPIARVALVATVVVCTWSLFVSAQGGLLRATDCWNAGGSRTNVDADPERVWSWSDPQFVSGVRAVSSRGAHEALLGACPPGL